MALKSKEIIDYLIHNAIKEWTCHFCHIKEKSETRRVLCKHKYFHPICLIEQIIQYINRWTEIKDNYVKNNESELTLDGLKR